MLTVSKLRNRQPFLTSVAAGLIAAIGLFACLSIPVIASNHKAKMPILHQNAVILFQGDSITDGGRWQGNDPNHIYGQDYGFIVAGRLGVDIPERNLTFLNRGVGGNKVADLAARWQADVLDLKPDLVSILIGVNDAQSSDPGDGPQHFEAVYSKLIDDTRAALPGVQIVLGEPFTLPVGWRKEHFDTWWAHVQEYQDVVLALGKKYGLPVIRYQDVFDAACKKAPAEHWSWDGIHPTPAGHQLMADEWIRVVGSIPDQMPRQN